MFPALRTLTLLGFGRRLGPFDDDLRRLRWLERVQLGIGRRQDDESRLDIVQAFERGVSPGP